MLTSNLLFFGIGEATVYADFYDTSTPIIAAVLVSFFVSLVCAGILYFVMPLIRRNHIFTGFFWDYVLTWIISTAIVFGVCYLMVRSLLLHYIETYSLETLEPGLLAKASSGTIDMVWYADVAVAIGFIMFFLISLILKRFAPTRTATMPFASKEKRH